MILLRDKDIRPALIERLSRQRPKAIIEELRIDDGRAVADVVALFEEAHCYEIKGATDKIERLKSQGSYFCQSFRKITLVTTDNHINRAQLMIPEYWGIVLVKAAGDRNGLTRPKFSHVRKALTNPDFCKSTALLTLWRQELIELTERDDSAVHRSNRSTLAAEISSKLSKSNLAKVVTDLLADRVANAEPLQ